ncbi:MAG: choice-of-anchor D domain-containing protein, partial [Solirubrobacteraceae bacterium]
MKPRFLVAAIAIAAVTTLVAPAARAVPATTTTIRTYTMPGQYTFTVPAGITSIDVTAIGGAGGHGCAFSPAGGEGARVSATLAVTPGKQLEIGVAGNGASSTDATCGSGGGAGGSGGGGAGGGDLGGGFNGSGGGGGASAVGADLLGPAYPPLLVAAGGGGSGSGNLGGAGGNAGSAGGAGENGAVGGQPGAEAAGGAGGTGSVNGAAGQYGLGGAGAANANPGSGGGGGGGYFGGGGGGASSGGSAGGGGGSSFIAFSASNVIGPAASPSPAEVSITYAIPVASADRNSLTFARTPRGTASAERPLILTNNGSAPLVVSAVILGGKDPADYLVEDGCQQPVAPGQGCTIEVRFDPQAAGARPATLTLLTNAPTAPAAVALSGTGSK